MSPSSCPLAHDDSATFGADEWLERVCDAMKTLDLVVLGSWTATFESPKPEG